MNDIHLFEQALFQENARDSTWIDYTYKIFN